MSDAIDSKSKVTLHFTLSLADGTLAETTHIRKKPAEMAMGDGSLPPNFEKCLVGLKTGDKKSFDIACKEAFGDVNMDKIHTMSRSQFPDDEVQKLEEGVIMSFNMPNGQPVAGVIHKIDKEEVVVDFNYPLAGHDVRFDVEIIDVA